MSSSHRPIPPPDARWQACTQTANRLMQEGSYQEAQAAYLQAVQIAEAALTAAESQQDNEHAVHLYAVSCHNLADNFLQLGQSAEAEMLLTKAYQRSLCLMQNDRLPYAFRWEAMRALQQVALQRIDFYRRQGQTDAVAVVLSQSSGQIQSFLTNEQP